MLISIVYTLQSETDVQLPADLGRANYAAILANLNRIDPVLAGAIHDGDGPKPLTCSGILNRPANRGGVSIRAGTPYFLRVSGLLPEVSAGLAYSLLENPPTTWELAHHSFSLTHATADSKEHAWAGQSSYEALAAYQLLTNESLERRATMHFDSPTAFKSNGMTIPIPTPDLVFGSLVDRWNAFSPVVLSPEVRRFGAEMVAVSRYKLESQSVAQKSANTQRGALRIGGMGSVTYIALGGDRYWLGTLQMLADFALYSGVGVQTATGMGQTRRMV
jgi:CRISPR-associated endoribonuclease Cas6